MDLFSDNTFGGDNMLDAEEDGAESDVGANDGSFVGPQATAISFLQSNAIDGDIDGLSRSLRAEQLASRQPLDRGPALPQDALVEAGRTNANSHERNTTEVGIADAVAAASEAEIAAGELDEWEIFDDASEHDLLDRIATLVVDAEGLNAEAVWPEDAALPGEQPPVPGDGVAAAHATPGHAREVNDVVQETSSEPSDAAATPDDFLLERGPAERPSMVGWWAVVALTSVALVLAVWFL